MTEDIFQLKDGRKLGYAFYGPGDGEPVLYFHGTPSSRLEPLILENYNKDFECLLNKYKINVIAIDRPGMGHSTYNPKGSFTSFANDVHDLTTYLRIISCKVLCWSGGGSYALSLAYHFPQLIQQVNIITGFTKSFSEHCVFRNMNGNFYYFWVAKNMPWLMRGVMNVIGKKEANKPIPKWLSQLPDVDNDLLDDPTIINHFTKVTLNEACRNGSRGLVHEASIYFNETGYKLADIVQPVHYWWGTKDNTVTHVHAEAVEKQVSNAVMHYKENEGHLSIFVNYIEEVLETLSNRVM
jgi:pimeloyl-ACP methyl ester carboxylesterase